MNNGIYDEYDLPEVDLERVVERVTLRHQRKYWFILHSVIFTLGVPLFAQLTLFLFLVWVGVWMTHLVWIFYHSTLEAAIAQELEQERQRIAKAKREARIAYGERLGDDGEWLEYDQRV